MERLSGGELQLRAGGRLLDYECGRQRAGEAEAPAQAQRAAWCAEPGEASGCPGNQAERAGPRPKGRGKRKAAEVSERRPAEQKRRRPKQQQRRRKRQPRDKALPLKRTYGDTRVDRRLLAAAHGPGPGPGREGGLPARRLVPGPGPPRPQEVWAQARGRGQPAGPWEPLLRCRGCRTVSLSDAQTQTESGAPSSCSEPSTSESGLDPSGSPGEESSSTGSSSRGSSQLSVVQAACPPASPLGLGLGLAGPRHFPDRSRAGGRRGAASPRSRRPDLYSEGPRSRRRSVPRVRECSPQDGWGCLIL